MKTGLLARFVRFVASLIVGIVFFSCMIASQFGAILHTATVSENTSLLIVLCMPLLILLFLFFGFGVLQEWLKPLNRQETKGVAMAAAAIITALVSIVIFVTARAASEDAVMLAGFLDITMLAIVLVFWLINLFPRKGGLNST